MSEEDLRKIIKDHFKIKDGNLSINIKDKIIKIFDVGVQYENKEEKPNFVIDVGSIKSSHEVKQDTYHVIFDKEKKNITIQFLMIIPLISRTVFSKNNFKLPVTLHPLFLNHLILRTVFLRVLFIVWLCNLVL